MTKEISMAMAIKKAGWSCAALVVVGATTGCSAPAKASSTRPVEVTATSRQALATSNGALRASGRAEGPRDVSRGKDIQ